MDQVNWFEGQFVSGSLTFNVSEGCPPVEVSVNLEGLEYVAWHESRGSGEDHYIKTFRDWKQCAALHFPIMRSSTPFSEGSYTYPVQFQMPVGLPGTYILQMGKHSGLTAMIQYNLYVELMVDGECIGRAWSPIVLMQGSRSQQQLDVERSSRQQMI